MTSDDFKLNDIVRLTRGIVGVGSEYLEGRVVKIIPARCCDRRDLELGSPWSSLRDQFDFGACTEGRHLPPCIHMPTKRPLPRYYGPIIYRVDRPHKTQKGKTVSPRFVHVFPRDIALVNRPPPPEVPMEELVQALLANPDVATQVHRWMGSSLYGSEVAEERPTLTAAIDIVTILKREPRMTRELLFVLEHGGSLRTPSA